MSCKICEETQKEILNQDHPIAYVRVGIADVAIVGCKEHLKELLENIKK